MEERITSAKNPIVKRLRRLLTSSKARREENIYVAEGIHLAKSLVAAEGRPSLVILAEAALVNGEIIEALSHIDTSVRRVILSDDLFESLATIHASVGILLLFTPAAVSHSAFSDITQDCVFLENVQDPGNLGTILRTAAATGIRMVALSSGCASPWSPKVLRAGMGAQFALDIYENVDIESLAGTAQLPLVATTLSQESVSLYDMDLRQPLIWLFGNEGQGVSDSLAQMARFRVFIPQAPGAVESLNVATAAAVCLYEQYRQNTS